VLNKKQGEKNMSNLFEEVKKKHFKTLKQYVPVVERVHGGSHPEFHAVREQFDAILEKTKKAGSEKADLNDEFAKLREITDNYTVPGDVCESYEAVYNMLAELDNAYHA
jgi:iron-sulfur cluster repair protein YtfE (RIC family)